MKVVLGDGGSTTVDPNTPVSVEVECACSHASASGGDGGGGPISVPGPKVLTFAELHGLDIDALLAEDIDHVVVHAAPHNMTEVSRVAEVEAETRRRGRTVTFEVRGPRRGGG